MASDDFRALVQAVGGWEGFEVARVDDGGRRGARCVRPAGASGS